MYLKTKFAAIEHQLKANEKKAEKEFGENYEVITRAQTAKGMLSSGNTIVMIRDAAVNCYDKYSSEAINLILEIFNGKDNKVYTCQGVNKLKKLFENSKITLQRHLEVELNSKLHSPALGGNKFEKGKIQVQEEMKPKLEYINNETTFRLGSKLSGIKRTSWHTSWLFQQATTIAVSMITAIIVHIITKHYSS